MVQLGRLFIALGREHVRRIKPKFYLPKNAQNEIWGRSKIRVAWKESFSGKKTRREWKPNVLEKTVYSEILEERLTFNFTTKVLRKIDEFGGFDNYILKSPIENLGTKQELSLRSYLTTVQEMKKEGKLSLDEIKKELQPKPRPNKHVYIPRVYHTRFYFDLRGPRRHMIYC